MKFGFALLIIGSLHASAANFTCGNEDLNFKNVYDLPGQGYWMQASGKCEITYTTVGGFWGKRYNLCERTQKPMTNSIDPFPLPGTQGEIYIHPGWLSFYQTKSLPKDKSKGFEAEVKPFFHDETLNGDYESVGLVKGDIKKSEGATVRVMVASGQYRDYNIKKSWPFGGAQVKPLGVTQPICNHFSGADPREAGKYLLMPILSRNGTMFATRDANNQNTNIYSIKEGECKLLSRITYPTNKVSFSFDNKTVLFTTTDVQRYSTNTLMAMDIDSGKIHPLSGPKENVLYMTSSEDGRIFYTRARSTGHLSQEKGVLVEMDSNFVEVPADPTLDQALGEVYARKCNLNMPTDQQQIVGHRLSQSACKDLVNQVADADLQNLSVANITKDQLSKKCATQSQPSYKMEVGTQ
jgi:hypothetical protein